VKSMNSSAPILIQRSRFASPPSMAIARMPMALIDG
jgi:hypothetical protein